MSNPQINSSRLEIQDTFSKGVIYIYSIPDQAHAGRLKIGSATVGVNSPTQSDIEKAAQTRVGQQTKTADVQYYLEHAELAITNSGVYFSDAEVHSVLLRSGYQRKSENTKNARSEWFEVDLVTAKNAILAVKEGRKALTNDERLNESHPVFPFRPNQREAIDITSKAIRQGRKRFLWNAKMRFGKTSAAMQVAKENQFQKVLIVTHRPSVSVDWYADFNSVFAGTGYEYSSKTKGENLEARLNSSKPFVYFASLQDLRLSEQVVADEHSGSHARGFNKNKNLFDTQWDMLIVDEAHEGTQSNLGDTTLSKISCGFKLELSGTPFNILHKLEDNEVYTWDYVMEQSEKIHWDELNSGVPNPYNELPSLAMFTYDINKFSGDLGGFTDHLDGAFKFHEFFRVKKDDDGNDTPYFIHEEKVRKFLDLLVDNTLATKFPYATDEYRSYNKHSLWLLPNRTKAIEAMEKLLRAHPVFNAFGVVNISGDAKEDDAVDLDAKSRVTAAIRNNEYTITLTGQRLTTGASIPEWTAVCMMSDTNSATTYLQTAFRCQTPAKINGMLKTQGYVFDFAPDRTLRLIAEVVELNHKSSKTNSPEQRKAMGEFLNFCPIIAAESGSMKPYDVEGMLLQLKKAIIERVRQNGFDDPRLYNDELLQLDEMDISRFNELKKVIGTSTAERTNEILVNDLGMDKLEVEKAEEAERKKKQKQQLSEDEQEWLQKLKEAREQKNSAISILRAVSIRMPMMVYGADISVREDITLQKFIDLVDGTSWQEFMPAGLTKETFRDFTKYYDEEVFRGVAHNIRSQVFDFEHALPTERVQALAQIFNTFKNPDKETVLTPWNVVNMHLSATLGGSDFREMIQEKPTWKTQGEATTIWSNSGAKVLEINSKSGLYPLLAAYNFYSRELIKFKKSEDELPERLWAQVLANNIFVLCKSPMAKTITERTLAGYSRKKMNIVYIEDLVGKLRHDGEYGDYDLAKELQEKFNLQGESMKFTAIVGNPPYQETIEGRGDQPPIYHLFLESAYRLSDVVTMIHPARFLFNAGLTPKDWNKKMLEDEHLKVVYFEQDSSKVFPNTDIKGGVAITLRDAKQEFGKIGIFTSFPELQTILEKVEVLGEDTLDSVITGRGIYRLTNAALQEHPEVEKIQSEGHKSDIGTGAFNTLKGILFSAEKPSDGKEYVQVIGLFEARRARYWIDQRYLNRPSNFDKYKIVLPNANGTGAIGEILSTPLIGEPLIGYSETFIGIGEFDVESEAQAALKYVRSKFARTMLGVLKVTQHNSRDKWAKVPLQNFTATSDIDWSQSIADIDKLLYAKYKLNNSEIEFIETRVRAME